MGKKPLIFLGIIIVITALALSASILKGKTNIAILIVVTGSILIFFASFESKRVLTEKIVLLALLSAIASAGRVIFSAIPSVKPSSFIIIMTGMVFGGESGFIVGAITAFTSNLVMGQGPWTIWQMFAWGLMGLSAGAFSKILKVSKPIRIIFGFTSGILFGWIMNLYYISLEINVSAFIAACISSAGFDLAHAFTNALLLLFLGDAFIKIFSRITLKYGL